MTRAAGPSSAGSTLGLGGCSGWAEAWGSEVEEGSPGSTDLGLAGLLTLSPAYLPVSLGFFDDILIPPESLQQPAKLYPPRVRARTPPQKGPHSSGWLWGL